MYLSISEDAMVRKLKRLIRYGWSDFKCGILNLVIWFPVIWKDRNWDYLYIFTILHKKLSLMERFIREDGIHVKHKQDADKIKTCILLLDRLMEDEYFENVFSNHDKKWGYPDYNFTPIEGDKGSCSIKVTRKHTNTKEEIEQERKEFRRLSPKPEKMKKQDVEYLFEVMGKYVREWWD